MRENIFRKMWQGKIILKLGRNKNNRNYKIAERTIVMCNMQMCSVECIAMKFLVMANAVNFLYYCRDKKDCEKKDRKI